MTEQYESCECISWATDPVYMRTAKGNAPKPGVDEHHVYCDKHPDNNGWRLAVGVFKNPQKGHNEMTEHIPYGERELGTNDLREGSETQAVALQESRQEDYSQEAGQAQGSQGQSPTQEDSPDTQSAQEPAEQDAPGDTDLEGTEAGPESEDEGIGDLPLFGKRKEA